MTDMFRKAVMTTAVLVAIATAAAAGVPPPPTVLHKFTGKDDGGVPVGGIVHVGKSLYGTTSFLASGGPGTLYRISISSRRLATLHRFDGVHDGASVASVIAHGGILYGTTQTSKDCEGSVFTYDITTRAETTLYCFQGGKDGAQPLAGLLYRKGKLYGTTSQGGSADRGTVFVVDAKSGKHSVLFSFPGGADGGMPAADLILVDGVLYGTAAQGGVFNGACATDGNDPGCGIVFKLDPATRDYSVLHRFEGGSDGAEPRAGLLAMRGKLYGTTHIGGSVNNGTAFTIHLASGNERVLHDFDSSDDGGGTQPMAPFIQHKGTLYGTTLDGGLCNCGIVFRMDPHTGKLLTLTDFQDPTIGAFPAAPVVYLDGNLFGVTESGGVFGGACPINGVDNGCGMVFEVSAQD